MIQKYRNPQARKDADAALKSLGVLDTSEDVVVLVDEAHRSQGSALHANLLKALPNCARIGFTGTPIIMGRRKYTATIFGEYLDRYTILAVRGGRGDPADPVRGPDRQGRGAGCGGHG